MTGRAVEIFLPGAEPEDGTAQAWTVSHRTFATRPETRRARVRDPGLAAWFAALDRARAIDVEVADPSDDGVMEILSARLPRSPAASVSPGPDGDGLPLRDPELEAFLDGIRSFLERSPWPEFRTALGEPAACPPGDHASAGMCRVTAAFLTKALAEFDPEGGWEADGGHPTVLYGRDARQFKSGHLQVDGGMWDRERGAWDGHYWTTGVRGGRRVLVDVTADQYGWDPVVVADAEDPRYRASYRRSTVSKDLGAAWIERRIGPWLVAWRAERRPEAAPAP